MTTYIAYSAADLRTYLGYWDDSASAKVDGTAVHGDRVVIAVYGTTDLGATDNILMPAAGVWIDGPGRDVCTIQARMAVKGSGGASSVTRLSGWTLDVAGKTSLALSGFGNYGAAELHDSSLLAEEWGCVNSSPSDEDNTLTIVSRSTSQAIRAVLIDCYLEGSSADCLSTKGISGVGNTASVVEAYRCIAKTHGAGGTDQVFTAHDGVALHSYGCYIEGNKYALSADSDASPMDAINCHIRGLSTRLRFMSGCIVDRLATTYDVCVPLPNGVVEHCYFGGTGYAGTTQGAFQLATTAGTTRISYCEFVNNNNAYVTGIVDGGATSATADIDHCLVSSVYRGIDLRNGSGHSVDDCIITDSGQYSLLFTAGPNLSSYAGTLVDDNTFPNGLITPTAIDAGAIDALRASICTMRRPMPSWENARNHLMVRGGWAAYELAKGVLVPR
jgi:hypothetical protein